DAEDLDLPPLKPLPRRPKRPQQQPRSPEEMLAYRAPDHEDATTWRVSFRMTPRAYDPGRKSYPRNPPNLDPEALRPCRGYAFRIEALRRVKNNRDTYILRYARRLARIEHARIQVMADYVAEAKAKADNRAALVSELTAQLGPPK